MNTQYYVRYDDGYDGTDTLRNVKADEIYLEYEDTYDGTMRLMPLSFKKYSDDIANMKFVTNKAPYNFTYTQKDGKQFTVPIGAVEYKVVCVLKQAK